MPPIHRDARPAPVGGRRLSVTANEGPSRGTRAKRGGCGNEEKRSNCDPHFEGGMFIPRVEGPRASNAPKGEGKEKGGGEKLLPSPRPMEGEYACGDEERRLWDWRDTAAVKDQGPQTKRRRTIPAPIAPSPGTAPSKKLESQSISWGGS